MKMIWLVFYSINMNEFECPQPRMDMVVYEINYDENEFYNFTFMEE